MNQRDIDYANAYRSPVVPLNERRMAGDIDLAIHSANRKEEYASGNLILDAIAKNRKLSAMKPRDYSSDNALFANASKAIQNRYAAKNAVFGRTYKGIEDKYAKGNEMFAEDSSNARSGNPSYNTNKYNALEGIKRIISMIRR